MKNKFKKVCVALIAGAGLTLSAAGGASAIVDGTQADAGARPYQVSLQSGGEHYCGGSIIDATTIVTAAHCVEGETADGTSIRAGVTDVTSTAGQDVGVISITPHPQYQQSELADIAIIKLATPLVLEGNVQALPLASAKDLAAAQTGTVSGWGAISETGADSNSLLQADVPLVSDASCARQLNTDARTETCAGGTGTDSCYGDSGGPLTIATANGPALAGVVSWGEECGGATPGVYADVPGLTNWVNANRGDAPADQAAEDPATTDADEGYDDGYFDDDMDAEFDGEFDDEGYDDGYVDDDMDAEFDGEFDDEGYDDGYFDDDMDAEFDGEFDDEGYDDGYFDDDMDAEFDGDWFFVDDDGSVWVEDDEGNLFYAGDLDFEEFDSYDHAAWDDDSGDWDDAAWDEANYDADYGDAEYEDADWDDADYGDADWDDADYGDADYGDAEYEDADW